MSKKLLTAGVGFALALAVSAPVSAQGTVGGAWNMSPMDRGMAVDGLPVIPLFEGYFENPDGTYTFEFGFWNRNQSQSFVVPIGTDNSIEPAQYSGGQPEVFMPSKARGYSHGDNTGNFTVTVPKDFAEGGGQVVWTLRTAGSVNSVPGELALGYDLSLESQAGGSLPPMLKLEEDGPELWGSFSAPDDPRAASSRRALGRGEARGSNGNPAQKTATVGVPLTLTVWAKDRFVNLNDRKEVTPGITWFTHQGPAAATFTQARVGPDGSASATVTFPEAGRYLLLARADNFRGSGDSSIGDHCCWTNGYVEVTVSASQ